MIMNINHHKLNCKKLKKFNNPENLTLMQIQHRYAVSLGFKNWLELKIAVEKGD